MERSSIDDVCKDLDDKLVRRHPHVFGGAHAGTVADVEAIWAQVKLVTTGLLAEGVFPVELVSLFALAVFIDLVTKWMALAHKYPDAPAEHARPGPRSYRSCRRTAKCRSHEHDSAREL